MLTDGAPSKAKKGSQYFRASYLTLAKAVELKTMSNAAQIIGVGFGNKFEAGGLDASKCDPFCATKVKRLRAITCLRDRTCEAHGVSPAPALRADVHAQAHATYPCAHAYRVVRSSLLDNMTEARSRAKLLSRRWRKPRVRTAYLITTYFPLTNATARTERAPAHI